MRLDPNDPGRWPLAVPHRRGRDRVRRRDRDRHLFLRLELETSRRSTASSGEETELRAAFEDRQAQGRELRRVSHAARRNRARLRRDAAPAPGKTEVPNLLVDISQTGLGAGLEEKLFQPTGEVQKDFYAELPIKLRYTGSYHELGKFVSGIAALPRIVTLHDIDIKPAEKDSTTTLTLDVTAKTYRYLDETGTETK